jgi:hypothetical protein
MLFQGRQHGFQVCVEVALPGFAVAAKGFFGVGSFGAGARGDLRGIR